MRVVNAIENTLLAVKESSFSSNNSRLANRMTSAKSLPTFSVDPLDWVRFKQAYDLSTELCGYNNRENITRLFETLVGDAREATKSLFAAGSNASDIIQTLEMRFGNSKYILSKILNDIRELPQIDLKKVNLIEFATKLKNAVTDIKSLNSIGYIYSPELVDGIIKKLPSSMIYKYVRYASGESQQKPDLEKLSDFLFLEANMALAAGVIDVNLHFNQTVEGKNEDCKESRVFEKSVFSTSTSETKKLSSKNDKNNNQSISCAFCQRKSH